MAYNYNEVKKIGDKTIFFQFPEYNDFFYELWDALLYDVKDGEVDVINSFKYGHWLYLRWGHRTYKGTWVAFFDKFKSRYASTFHELRQKERIYKNIYADLKLETNKLVSLKDKEYSKVIRDEQGDEKSSGDETLNRDRTSVNIRKETDKRGSRNTSKERPFETADLIGGHFGQMVQDEYKGRADWLSGENIEITGYTEVARYPAGHPKHGEIIYDDDGNPLQELSPNWNNVYSKDNIYDNSYKKLGDRSDHRKYASNIIDKTIDRQEQPMINGQIARIIMGYKNFEVYPTDLIESFVDFFSDVYVGGGKYVFNPITWEYVYKSRAELNKLAMKKVPVKVEDEASPEKIERADRELSRDEWEELWTDKEKPCMPDWYLEQIYRLKKRISKKPNKEDADIAREELCDIILDTFYRQPYIPSISVFEAVMGGPAVYNIKKKTDPNDASKVLDGIYEECPEGTPNSEKVGPWTHYKVDLNNIKEATKYKNQILELGDILICEVEGFMEFKSRLWQSLRTAHRDRRMGLPVTQVFPALIGPPGTGKSEIARKLAEAFKAPLAIVNCSGITDPEYFEGKRPTLQNSNYGRILNGFINETVLAEITIDDLKLEIDEITHYIDPKTKEKKLRPMVNINDWERERMNSLQKEVDEWIADNEERKNSTPKKEPRLIRKKAYRSRGTIFLLDEFEKMASIEANYVVGKMTDRELNYTFTDNYLGYRVDLSKCWILCTANFLEQIPQFLAERLLSINIELLDWKQRKRIIESRFQKELKKSAIWHLRNRITDKFVEMCITETFGVRAGINNIAGVIQFLKALQVDKEEFDAGLVPGLRDPFADLGVLDSPDRIIETSQDDYIKQGAGVIKLIWDDIGGQPQEIVLNKKLGVEKRTKKDTDGNVQELIDIVTGNDPESGKTFVPSWGGDHKQTIDGKDYMWWYNYVDKVTGEGNKVIGYITKTLERGEATKPAKPMPYKEIYRIRGKIELKERDGGDVDDNMYMLNNINASMNVNRIDMVVNKIKLVAQLGIRERGIYNDLITTNLITDYDLVINNTTKTTWKPAKRELTVYSRWDLIKRI